jgi:predicted transcriptional regulator
MREQNIEIHGINGLRNVLIIDETSDDWRIWKALHRLLSRKNDLGVRVYITLLEKGDKMAARDIAIKLSASIYSVRRVLKDLLDLDLVTQEQDQRSRWRPNYWSIKRPILGIVRLFPNQYFQHGYPPQTADE